MQKKREPLSVAGGFLFYAASQTVVIGDKK